MESKPLIAVVGETASGKSALALDLARRFDGEIVCADSWTVYTGFDIGTAKPTAQDRRLVAHHLLDVADPAKGFNASLFKTAAIQAIHDIQSRAKVVFLVGGTGLYIDSVLFDYSFLPAPPDSERAQRNGLSIQALLDEIVRRDISTEGIDIRNKRRLIRLLETNGQRPRQHDMRSDCLVLGVRVPAESLRERITERVDRMFTEGLEAEVRTLAQKYGWDAEPMKGIGYYEFKDYFAGSRNLTETKQRIISHTIGLAKRQRTWFKRNKGIQWVTEPRQAVDITTTFLSNYQL